MYFFVAVWTQIQQAFRFKSSPDEIGMNNPISSRMFSGSDHHFSRRENGLAIAGEILSVFFSERLKRKARFLFPLFFIAESEKPHNNFSLLLFLQQNFSFTSNEQGIAYNSMMTCMEDKSGNIWFSSDYGTKLNDSIGGVWRNDGKTLTKFSTKDGLLNNAVFLLLEDKDENIWIASYNGGVNVYKKTQNMVRKLYQVRY